jgi:hypothetical protein
MESRKTPHKRSAGLWIILALLLLAGRSASALSATVQAVGWTFVVIDAGTLHGLKHGDLICLKDQGGKEVGCGNLGEARPRLSEVRLSSWTAARVKIGHRAVGQSLKPSTKSEKVSQSEILTFVRVVEKIRGQDKIWTPPSSALVIGRTLGLPPATIWFRSARVKLAILGTAKLPFSYQVPKYNVRGELDESDTLWVSDREVVRTPWGGELSGAMPFTDHIALVTTLHMRKLPSDEVTVSYDARDPSLGATGKLNGLTYGAGLDLEFGWPLLPALEAIFSLGLEGDVSRIEYKKQTLSPTEEEKIGSLTSELQVWSGRFGFDLAWVLGGGFALDLGGKVLLPQVEKANTKTATPFLKDTLSPSQKDASADALKSTLNHHKSKVGSQVYLGISYAL